MNDAFLKEVLLSPLSANPTKWSNTLKQFVGKLPTNCLSVFDHFAGLAPKRLTHVMSMFCFYITSKHQKTRGNIANINLFKVSDRNTKKCAKYVQSQQKNNTGMISMTYFTHFLVFLLLALSK